MVLFDICRASSTSVVTARSSVSRTANQSRFSSNARTPAASHGPFSSDVNTGRVSPRYAYHPSYLDKPHPLPHHHPLLSATSTPSQTTTTTRTQHTQHKSKSNTPPQEVAKKRTRRTVKQQRGIVGASLDVIKERRTQRPEARAAARQQAIASGKAKKSEEESKKKAEKAKTATKTGGTAVNKVSKQQAKGAAPKVQARTR